MYSDIQTHAMRKYRTYVSGVDEELACVTPGRQVQTTVTSKRRQETNKLAGQ